MTCYEFKDYNLVGFEKGKGYKKYNAILQNKKSKGYARVPFGDTRYEHYKDSALGLYIHLDHLDKVRRVNYQKRHKGDRLNCFSPGYFSWYYLW